MKVKKRLNDSFNFFKRDFLSFLSQFEESFMVGLAFGVSIVCVCIYRALGLGFALTAAGQMHVLSLHVVFMLVPITYFLLKEKENGKRVLFSIIWPIFVFTVHDIAWLIETVFVPQIFKIPIVLDLRQYIYHFSKNAINLILSLAVLRYFKFFNNFKVNKYFILALITQIIFHVVNIVFNINNYVYDGKYLLVMYVFDCLPYILCFKKGEFVK